MLIYAALATLLCSSLIDARLAPVNSVDTLALCKDQQQPYCKNPAVKIDKSTEFYPTIKASGRVDLNLTVKSEQPLTFPVHSKNSKVEWTIKPPGDKCKWVITEADDVVTFRAFDGEGKEDADAYDNCRGSEVNIAFRKKGADIVVDVTGDKCDNKQHTLSKPCNYVPPNSDSVEGWDIWALIVSAEGKNTSTASITLKDAYVVYDAPEPTTTTSNGTFNGTTENPNNATTALNVKITTPEADLSAIAWGLIGGCVIFFLLFVVAAVMASIFFRKTRKLRKNPDPQALREAGLVNKEEFMKRLVKDGWRQDDLNRTTTEERNCHDDATCLESRSKRLEDENKVAAAETAQKPAPGEGQPEPKSQRSQEVFNKGAAGTSNQPAADADPQKNA